ncbi:MAG: acyl-CoA dehydrogenase family protein [Acidimicrobiales bacterium]|nr:acyl-CoA dehydrogenase family protein [Acidimicrobiales bacterium]
MAPVLRSEAEGSEAARSLTPAAVGALRGTGVLSMTMSRALGGPELSPIEQIEVLEELSSADGSAGWCAMINSDGGYMTAFLDPTVAKEMYPSLDLATAVVAQPAGQAVVEPGGYRVNGRWSFASGGPHASWFFLNAIVIDHGEMQPGIGGLPRVVMVAVPAEQVTLYDTWHAAGLCATASGDVNVEEVFVPEERTFSHLEGDAIDPSPLYRWRWMFFVNLGAVPLGIARAALAEAAEIANSKVTFPTLALARDDADVQASLGRATALVGSARAYLHDTVGRVWDVLVAGSELRPELWSEYRLALTNAAHASKRAVDLAYEALGTSGIHRASILNRCHRDTTTLAQHLLTQPKTFASSGRVLLGLEPDAIGY